MTKRSTAFLLLLALMTVGCSTGHVQEEEPSSMPATVPASAMQPQSSDARMEALQTSLTELLERIDVVNDRLTRLENAQQNAPAPAAVMTQPVSIAPPVVATPPAEMVRPAPVPRASVVAPAPTSRATAAPQIYDEYRNALVLYGKNRYVDARQGFQRVFDSDPAGELADNALYWIGETYYVTGAYSEAMRYYTRVTQEFADQNKAPDAMFKMGLTYEKSGDLQMARRTFDDCIKKYPYSIPASSARLELKRIKY